MSDETSATPVANEVAPGETPGDQLPDKPAVDESANDAAKADDEAKAEFDFEALQSKHEALKADVYKLRESRRQLQKDLEAAQAGMTERDERIAAMEKSILDDKTKALFEKHPLCDADKKAIIERFDTIEEREFWAKKIRPGRREDTPWSGPARMPPRPTGRELPAYDGIPPIKRHTTAFHPSNSAGDTKPTSNLTES